MAVKVDGVESEDDDEPEEETDVPDDDAPSHESDPLKPSEWIGRNDVIIVYNKCYCSPIITVLPS